MAKAKKKSKKKPVKKKKKARSTKRGKTAKSKRPKKKKAAARKPKRAAKAKRKSKKQTKKQAQKQALTDLQNRQHPRIPMRVKIDYFKDPGVFLYDYSRNLGRGGIFIETEQPMPAGTDLHLMFTLPQQEAPVEVHGRVVWVHERNESSDFRGVPGMGIQFSNPEGQNKEALDRFFREIDYDNLTF